MSALTMLLLASLSPWLDAGPCATADPRLAGGRPLCELHGRVKFVDTFPDYKIKFVRTFPDARVKFVDHFPDEPGRWKIVNTFPDFTVRVVDNFPDFTVRVVDNFPGCPR